MEDLRTEAEAMIARLRDPYIGKCCDHADEAADMLAAQAAEIERLTRENFALAADQCHAGYGDERGNHCCKEQDALRAELAMVTAERDAAREGERVAIETRDRFERGWLDTIKERDAAREALAKAVEERERVQHIKRGGFYSVVGEAELQAGYAIEEPAKLTIYQDDARGRLWARPTSEFRDGRFITLPARKEPTP